MNFRALTTNRDLTRRILLVLALIAAYRIGASVPAPGVSYTAVKECSAASQDSLLYGTIDLLTGGALLQVSVLALGVIPYITASIIVQLLGAVIPHFEALKKDGEAGRATLTQYTRYLTVALALLQGVGLYALASRPGALFPECGTALISNTGVTAAIVTITAVVAGAVLVTWFGELITTHGVGNGMSILITVSIIAGLPSQAVTLYSSRGAAITAAVAAGAIAAVAVITYIEAGQRRVPITYPRRGTLPAATTSYLPLKLNTAGVVPVIFASSLLYLPVLAVELTGSTAGWAQWLSANLTSPTQPLYLAVYATFVIFFAFFYTAIVFNPIEVSNDLANAGGFIPGIRPGRPTAEHLDYILTRLTTAGAVYLTIVAIVPIVALAGVGAGGLSALFGGTTLLIVAVVGMDTVKAINARSDQHNYVGFLTGQKR